MTPYTQSEKEAIVLEDKILQVIAKCQTYSHEVVLAAFSGVAKSGVSGNVIETLRTFLLAAENDI